MSQELKEKLASKKANLTDNARVVLEKRYLIKNEDGKVAEQPEDMFFRVAENIASFEKADVDKWTEVFYNMMADLNFLPNSPTLMNAGRELQQLSGCFVLPVGDSMEEIFEAVKNTALIHKSGGGTGFSFSRLRPKNDRVKSTMGISSGPLSFMRVFDIATETVKQGGTRRGANMGLLNCDHPEIEDFIRIKEKDGVLPNFNISVGITKEFMEALEHDTEYALHNPRNGEIVGWLKASDIFKSIVEHAWKNGEPGIIFIDRINEYNPTPHIGKIESTNPCGEQVLLPFESCNLGSVNLSKMISENGKLDFEKLKETVHNAVRFLDDVIDANCFPLPQIEKITKDNRKIGLGVMGFADALIKMDVPYNSEEAIRTAETMMEFVQIEGHKASMDLAKEKGSFPNFRGSVYDRNPRTLYFSGEQLGIRNATVTTIAPTGSISMIASCSSGIEPLFALGYEKHCLDGKVFLEIHHDFLKVAKEKGFYSEDLMKLILKSGSAAKIDIIPESIRNTFVTAHDVTPLGHVAIQAAFQKFTDNAVSKTVNFPHNATQKDVEDVYKFAYAKGCKGVTVYRDGSRANQVLTTGVMDKTKDGVISRDVKLPPVFENGPTHVIKKEGKKFYLHFSYLPEDEKKERPICLWIYTNFKYGVDELKICNKVAHKLQKLAIEYKIDKRFIKETVEKARQDYPHNRMGRMISLCMRHRVPRESILLTLMDVDGDNVSTLLTAVRKFMSQTLANGTKLDRKCPQCKVADIYMAEGCMRCSQDCGWSAC